MRRAWDRLVAFVPTRKAAAALFLLALVGYWFAALGWPLAKGRDSWDYLAYYLQLFDSDPPLEFLQLFRTPLTPLVLGVPLDLGGTVLLEIVLGVLYAVSIVAWSATALSFGRVPALLSALLLLVYPAYATLYHQASSDAIFATGLALWALGLARTLRRPSGWRFAALGAGIGILVLIRPANQVLLPIVLLPLLVPTAWKKRLAWSAASAAAVVGLLGAWSLHNGVRYDDATVASRRTRVGAVLARLPGRQDHLAGERRRVAAAWPADRGRGSAPRSRTRAWTCRSPRTWRTGRTTRPFG